MRRLFASFAVFALLLFGAADAQVGLPFPGPGTAHSTGGGAAFSLTYADSRSDTGTTATITYNAGGDPSCGTADPNRYVVVVAGRRSSSSNPPTSVVIAGVTATLASGSFLAQADNTAALVMQGAIYYAAVPTGTTCSVVINWDNVATMIDSAIGVYRLITSNSTPTVTKTAGAVQDYTVTLPAYTVPVGGASVNFYAARNSLSNSTPFMTWTNTSAANGDFYLAPQDRGMSGSTVQVAGSVTVTAATIQTSSTDAVLMSAAAWGP